MLWLQSFNGALCHRSYICCTLCCFCGSCWFLSFNRSIFCCLLYFRKIVNSRSLRCGPYLLRFFNFSLRYCFKIWEFVIFFQCFFLNCWFLLFIYHLLFISFFLFLCPTILSIFYESFLFVFLSSILSLITSYFSFVDCFFLSKVLISSSLIFILNHLYLF